MDNERIIKKIYLLGFSILLYLVPITAFNYWVFYPESIWYFLISIVWIIILVLFVRFIKSLCNKDFKTSQKDAKKGEI